MIRLLQIIILAILITDGPSPVHLQAKDIAATEARISFESLGEFEAVKDAEFRLGSRDRIVWIEDQWEFDRCAVLLPKLPKTDLSTNALLVIVSRDTRPRSLVSVRIDDKTLVVGIREGYVPRETEEYIRPKFLVSRLPTWPDPIRIEVNGKPKFTMERGNALAKVTDELWDEILRIHSGGEPTLNQKVRFYHRRSPNTSEEEIRRIIIQNKGRYRSIDKYPLYLMLFEDLVNIRAKPVVPRIFALIESMGKHDEASEAACNALIGIGGTEVVAGCKVALKSWNPQSRGTARSVLSAFGLPETRQLAYEWLKGPDIQSVRGALSLLQRIGLERRDVPEMVQGMQELETILLSDQKDPRRLRYSGSSSEDVVGFIYTLGTLGAVAEEALPVLEQMATQPRYPRSVTIQKEANEAVEKIKLDMARSSAKGTSENGRQQSLPEAVK